MPQGYCLAQPVPHSISATSWLTVHAALIAAAFIATIADAFIAASAGGAAVAIHHHRLGLHCRRR